jgi:hypothetical protein
MEQSMQIMLTVLSVLAISAPTHAGTYVWFKAWSSPAELAEVLRSVPEGRNLLAAAEKKDSAFMGKVSAGPASATETALEGKYVPLEGKADLQRRSSITIKQGLPLSDAVADLAHELVHFTRRAALDPYQEDFDLGKLVRRGIEGEGGELEAFTLECQVAAALEKAHASFPAHQTGARYRSGGAFQKEKARADYYALGTWLPKAGAALKKAFPELTPFEPVFVSGVSAKPYPLSLAEEFRKTRQATCESNRWRYKASAQAGNASGAPASSAFLEERKKLEAFHQKHCQGAQP